MERDQEVRILAATLKRLNGRDELIGMLIRLSPAVRLDFRRAIHAELMERRSGSNWDKPIAENAIELNPYMQPKALRNPRWSRG